MKWEYIKYLLFFLSGVFMAGCDEPEIKVGRFSYWKGTVSPDNGLDKRIVYYKVTDYQLSDSFFRMEQVPDRKVVARRLGEVLYSRYTSYREDYLRDPKVLDSPFYANLKAAHIEADSTNYRIFLRHGASLLNSENDLDIMKMVGDSLVEHDPEYQKLFKHPVNYWIYRSRGDSLYGPLTFPEYQLLKKTLSVPPGLYLRHELHPDENR